MKIYTRKINEQNKIQKIQYCCGGMRDAIDRNVVGFGDHEYKYNEVNFAGMVIYDASLYEDSESQYVNYYNWQIQYCPFCGARIEEKGEND